MEKVGMFFGFGNEEEEEPEVKQVSFDQFELRTKHQRAFASKI